MLLLIASFRRLSTHKPCIGVEIHAQLKSKKKLFSGKDSLNKNNANKILKDALVDWNAPFNTCNTLFDASVPGSLPVINMECVELATRASLALNCKLSSRLEFDRKHYDYFDLPAGYQITQQRSPLARDGFVQLNSARKIAIKQLHLEQDSAKTIQVDSQRLLIDLNRAGVGLIEIVSEPEIESAAEASSLVEHIHQLLQGLNVCSGHLEQGVMRIDVNVNWIDGITGLALTPRVELKNVNGIKAVEDAINVELKRQRIAPKEELIPETRLFVPGTNETIPLRTKAKSAEYCYLPEYDVAPVELDNSFIESVRQSMPKTRNQRINELLHAHSNLRPEILQRLWTHPRLPGLFEDCLELSPDLPAEFICNWITGDLLGIVNKYPGCRWTVTSKQISILLDLLYSKTINKSFVKSLLHSSFSEGMALNLDKLGQENSEIDPEDVPSVIEDLFKQHPERVQFLRSQQGHAKGSLDFFIGRILKRFSGIVKVEDITVLLKEKLYNVNKCG